MINICGQGVEGLYASSFQKDRMNDYFVADAIFVFQLCAGVELSYTLKNVLDREYATLPDKPMPGRSHYLSTGYSF